MTAPTITALPTPPSIADPTDFDTRADAFLGALASPFVAEVNASAAWIDTTAAQVATDRTASAASATAAAASATDADAAAADAEAARDAAQAAAGTAAGFTSTSTTSLTIGSGTQTLTIAAGKQITAGVNVRIADQAAPTTNYMDGVVSSYNQVSGQLVVSVPAGGYAGSGTKTAWNVSLSGLPGATGSGFTGGGLSTPINYAAQATVASASTTAIGAASSNYVKITGTTTITAFDTIAASAERIVEFAAALTLTHNATSLILPGGANITTAAGDVATFISEGSGNWRCTHYQRAASAPANPWTQIATLSPGAGAGAQSFTSISTAWNELAVVLDGVTHGGSSIVISVGDATPTYTDAPSVTVSSPVDGLASIPAARLAAAAFNVILNSAGGVVKAWSIAGGIRAVKVAVGGGTGTFSGAGTIRLLGR